MRSLLSALVVFAFSLPSSGVTLKQGDILYTAAGALVRLDPDTGGREFVSGCTDLLDDSCAGTPELVIGTGPRWSHLFNMLPQPDGSVVAIGHEMGAWGTLVVFRIDPLTGNRAIILRDESVGIPLNDLAFVVPFFPPQMAALPSWGIPLAAGILLGLALRTTRRAQRA